MKVSVIVPVYNVAPYLRECLDSILGQTLRDIELLCIDDGSTDGSLEILREYAAKDPRMTLLTQAHQSAGPARNKGIEASKGEYLLFLDSDDFFDEALLQTMYARAKELNSDLVLCNGRRYDMQTRIFLPWDCLEEKVLPTSPTFRASELGWRAFLFSTTGPINKLIRRELIIDNGLYYQDGRSSNDLYFICLCVALAQRISACRGKPLVTYRVGMTTNSQSRANQSPLDFTVSTLGFKEGLIQRGLYETYRAGYDCLAVSRINLYLQKAKTDPVAFRTIFEWLRDEGRSAYQLDLHSLSAQLLCSLLASYEGITAETDPETARLRVIRNRKKYEHAGMYTGHALKRMLYMTRRLMQLEGFVPGLKHSASLLLDKARR